MTKKKRVSFASEDFNPVVGVISVYTPDTELSPEDYHQEFLALLDTAEIEYVEVMQIKLRDIDPGYFFTKGKRAEMAELCQKKELDHLVISHSLSPLQQRNLENLCGCRVFDRTELIIDIFKKSAHSAEGQIQTEMAQLDLLKTRIAGRGREMAQQAGFVGNRGPGETEKEKLSRFYKDKLRQARKRLDQLAHSRTTQRKQRLKRGVPLIALVGYTNAGKTTVAHLLTNSDVLGENKLFATLDTTIRQVYLEPGRTALLSDTVGFISQLPHQLIAAFESTLDELQFAQIILHIVDSSNHAWRDHITVVNKTLDKLAVTAPRVLVFNKTDALSDEALPQFLEAARVYPGSENALFISALSKDDGVKMREALVSLCPASELAETDEWHSEQ